LQHLYARRAAADADRPAGDCFDRGGLEPGRHTGALLRVARGWQQRILQRPGRPQPGRRTLPARAQMRGRFISFEGIDGAGKSTHIDWYVQCLRGRGVDAIRTREPGGTPLAERLRDLLLAESMSLDVELMLMFAARQDHLER